MRKFPLFVFLFLAVKATYACDICGCSSGNYFIGPLPQFRLHFFGTRYSYRTFHTRLATDHTEFSNDFY
jgi:hypothetical protein